MLHPAVFKAAILLKEDTDGEDLPTICRKAGLSASQLSRLFHQQIGQTLTHYRNQQRLERFLELIGVGQHRNMMEAALESGFGSYAQFHRLFKESFKCSPSEFKRIRRLRTASTRL